MKFFVKLMGFLWLIGTLLALARESEPVLIAFAFVIAVLHFVMVENMTLEEKIKDLRE